MELPDSGIKPGSPALQVDCLPTELSGKPKEKVLVTQLCLTLCDHMDYNPPGSSILGILQAGILEWVPTPFSKGLPNPEIEPGSPTLELDALPSEPLGKPFVHSMRLKE